MTMTTAPTIAPSMHESAKLKNVALIAGALSSVSAARQRLFVAHGIVESSVYTHVCTQENPSIGRNAGNKFLNAMAGLARSANFYLPVGAPFKCITKSIRRTAAQRN